MIVKQTLLQINMSHDDHGLRMTYPSNEFLNALLHMCYVVDTSFSLWKKNCGDDCLTGRLQFVRTKGSQNRDKVHCSNRRIGVRLVNEVDSVTRESAVILSNLGERDMKAQS